MPTLAHAVERLLLRPFRDRAFAFAQYDRFLAELERRPALSVVPLGELASAGADRPLLALRHDVDSRLDAALELGRLEHARGIRSTYFVLHTAPYYRHRQELVAALRRLQDEYGHEIGWHNDLVSLQVEQGVDPRPYLAHELEWLRGNGIRIRGAAAHGSAAAQALGFHNNYAFRGWDEPQPGRPARDEVDTRGRRVPIAKLDPAEFGLEYEAYHLAPDVYLADSSFDERGRRWHPGSLDLDALRPGQRAILLIHPGLWERSLARRYLRTFGRAAASIGGSSVGRIVASSRRSPRATSTSA